MLIAYLVTSPPILFSSEPCDKYIDFQTPTFKNFEFNIKNQGETQALATACVVSNEIYFKATNGDLVHTYCFGETNLHPKSSELQINFKSPIGKLEDNLQESSNVTINLGVACRYKIWSILSKKCEGVSYSCIYLKDSYSLRLKETN